MTINDFINSSPTKNEFLAKGEYFLKQGLNSSKIGRLEKGILRGFILDHKGGELTTHFYKPGDLIFASYKSNVQSVFSVQALDYSVITIISFDKITNEINKNSKLSEDVNFEFKYIIDKLLIRFKSIVNLTPIDKFQYFLKEYPDLVNVIPSSIIANYLGISMLELNMAQITEKNKGIK